MSKRSGGEAAEPVETAPEPQAAQSAVRIGPAVAHGVTTVTKTDITLAVAIGQIEDDQRVLVPFLECAIYGRAGHEDEAPLWTGRLLIDNVAFLLEQAAVGTGGDPRPVCEHVPRRPKTAPRPGSNTLRTE